MGSLRPIRFGFLLVVSLSMLCPLLSAQRPSTQHREGLHENAPRLFALQGARIVTEPGVVIASGTVIVNHGKIEAVGESVVVPTAAQVIDVTGKTIYPGLIDSFSEQSVDDKSPDGGAPYWNAEVRPQLKVAEQLKLDNDDYAPLRKQGFTAALVAPSGGIIKGESALRLISEKSKGDALLRDSVAQHVRLTVGRGRGNQVEDYPNSPMGAVALARQAFYDAQWYHSAMRMVEVDPTLAVPEQNDALDALRPLLDGGRQVVIDTSNELFALRADRFAREFGLKLIIRGSGNEYRRLDAIRSTGRPVIVPLDFPKPPNVATAESAIDVTLESLMHWDLAPENPGRLAEAGVTILLSTYGLDEKKDFLEKLRQAVKRGLQPETALRALTLTPAKLYGIDDQIGTIAKGKLANLFITDGDLFESETQVIETWIAGERFEFKEEPTHDPEGIWRLELEFVKGKPNSLYLKVEQSDEKLSGTISTSSSTLRSNDKSQDKASTRKPRPRRDREAESKNRENEEEPLSIEVSRIGMQDMSLSATFATKELGFTGVAQLTLVFDQRASGDAKKSDAPQSGSPKRGSLASGYLIWPDGERTTVKATWQEQAVDTEDQVAGSASNEKSESTALDTPDSNRGADKESDAEKDSTEQAASFEVNYPLGAYGIGPEVARPASVLFRNATIWTCGPEGKIENGSVLISDGKIVAVGNHIEIPQGTTVIDAKGKHLSPGIIDCHSHMASDGGINESTQAITAEVRIGDFIDCDDITIYRQMAGGVTSSNILHGSANPIGGQNQVIKLRWGKLDDELKFSEAPQGIKFALGENVKQSNWGDEFTTRYPQTRMGVEQIVRDEFQAALAYRDRWEQWNRTKRGLPPRRDLELDAVVEILAGERWVHCHSYRQDEILALLRTLDGYGVTIGSLQHILEGYKVADAMKKHGATGSSFSDWWAYKFEVYDAIPFNGAVMFDQGIVVSFNSDDRELGRHLNQEAAKAVKYGGVPELEALKFVTLNPAIQLRIDQHVGSIEVGKHADIVLWSGPPLSNFSVCEQTWIDGHRYFDRNEDLVNRKKIAEMRNALIQKILLSGEEMRKRGEGDGDPASLWPRYDAFCAFHDHSDE